MAAPRVSFIFGSGGKRVALRLLRWRTPVKSTGVWLGLTKRFVSDRAHTLIGVLSTDGGRDSIQSRISFSRHATARGPNPTGRGNSPALIFA